MSYICEACGVELTNGIYCTDWLHGIVTESYSTDLCEDCHKYIVSVVKKAWEEIKAITEVKKLFNKPYVSNIGDAILSSDDEEVLDLYKE